MSQVIPSPESCCNPCTPSSSASSSSTPGPQGEQGEQGEQGDAGVSPITFVADYSPDPQPVMPAEGADVTVNVTSSTLGFEVGWYVRVQNWGTMLVTSVAVSSLTLRNPENTATGVYASNAAPGTSLAATSKIVVAGEQGPAGVSPAAGAPATATYITQTPDGTLSAEQALSLLATGLMKNTTATGVVSIVTQGNANTSVPFVDDAAGLTNGEMLRATATGIESVGAATARSTISAQESDALLAAIAALVTAADQVIYTIGVDTVALSSLTSFARTLLDDASAAVARTTLGVLPGYGLLGEITAADLNSATTDTAMTIGSARYRIDHITLESPSAAVTTATAGLFTAAGGGGTTLAADQALSATLTGTTKFMNLAEQAIVGTDTRTEGTLYFRVGTAEGAARTVNVKIYGWKFD